MPRIKSGAAWQEATMLSSAFELSDKIRLGISDGEVLPVNDLLIGLQLWSHEIVKGQVISIY